MRMPRAVASRRLPHLPEQLRQAGVRSCAEVAAVILERTGAVSVIRAREPIEPTWLADVRRADAALR